MKPTVSCVIGLVMALSYTREVTGLTRLLPVACRTAPTTGSPPVVGIGRELVEIGRLPVVEIGSELVETGNPPVVETGSELVETGSAPVVETGSVVLPGIGSVPVVETGRGAVVRDR